MQDYNVPQISRDVHYVGVKDWNRRMFDALIPLPQGTTYNSYLVRGEEKTALIDTVNPGFEHDLAHKVNQVVNLADLDYLVMNHAEPDHAGAIPHIMGVSKDARLVTTEKGAKMAEVYYKVPQQRITTVQDWDVIDLGGKTLQFIEAPWLHWPETMFTYLVQNKVLFPCDFLGSHTASGFYDDEIEELIPFAQRYFGEIMMPFRKMGAKALEKIGELEINLIAPSHGPIHRNPEKILGAYRRWTAGETKEKVVVVYVTMWNSTETMIKTLVETLLAEGIEVSLHNLVNADIGDVARDLVDSRAIVLGAPTVLGGMHPLAIYASHLVRALRPPLRYGVILSSYGWGGGALKQASEILGPTKIEVVGALEVNGPPSSADHDQIVQIGKRLSSEIR
ncbi:MAG: MBL fold metallo-hydrolase [Anaerolineae bacterium]|nr:MBL fold metallo-hydrolase [Anaerolineae bacterium]NIN96771.1 MBL fold metallo-hydrolase [Anaerolineae bacterium]NIQ79767.1 MBL fold metallo-hydrolase [Anaerolineae bacterium]